jgi:hypothetical protein
MPRKGDGGLSSTTCTVGGVAEVFEAPFFGRFVAIGLVRFSAMMRSPWIEELMLFSLEQAERVKSEAKRQDWVLILDEGAINYKLPG